MQKIVMLSDVKLNTSVDEVIQHLLQENKPVLIFPPANINVWAVYERHSLNIRNSIMRTIKNSKQRRILPEIDKKTESFPPATLVPKTEYLRLGSDDLAVLIKNGIVNLKFITEFYLHTENLDHELVSSDIYIDRHEVPINAKDLGINGQSEFHEYTHKIKFCFTRKNFNFLARENSIDNELVSLKTTIDSVCVFERDILSFVNQAFEREIDIPDIPETSPYYVKDFLSNKSDLDQLSILGFRYYWGKTANPPKVKGLVELIMNQLGYAQKKAEAAAFFLNPNPDGLCGKDKTIADGCQFPYLTYCLERFWHNQEKYNKNITAEIIAFLERKEGEEEGFSSDNAKYAELILRPSKFLRGPKKRI
ncbi:cytoplasmic protein [Shewanella xiamenensis]|uniref:cytoplasmic protein n=1 Tax=Shewanella xiamenensis TaxID=332186 RepID=UPI00222E0ECF|nr:cytoplasmic protein [Shewanella xiamenensis]